MKVQIQLSDSSNHASGSLSVKLVGNDGSRHEISAARFESQLELKPDTKRTFILSGT